MSAAPRITVRHGDRNYGPYGLDEVNRLLAEGRLRRDDLAWVEGAPEWTRLGRVPGTAPEPPPIVVDGEAISDRKILVAFLLALFLGTLGVHRFYCGRIGSGVAQLVLTLTVLGAPIAWIWSTVDWILIVCGAFRDGDERLLTEWT